MGSKRYGTLLSDLQSERPYGDLIEQANERERAVYNERPYRELIEQANKAEKAVYNVKYSIKSDDTITKIKKALSGDKELLKEVDRLQALITGMQVMINELEKDLQQKQA